MKYANASMDEREEVLVQLIFKALLKKAQRLKERPPVSGPQPIGDIVPVVFQEIVDKSNSFGKEI